MTTEAETQKLKKHKHKSHRAHDEDMSTQQMLPPYTQQQWQMMSNMQQMYGQ